VPWMRAGIDGTLGSWRADRVREVRDDARAEAALSAEERALRARALAVGDSDV